MRKYNVFEVLEYGPIVAHCKDSGVIITVNKTCFSSWTHIEDGHFLGGNHCLITDIEKVGDCTDFDLVCQIAEEWMRELLDNEGEDEPSC